MKISRKIRSAIIFISTGSVAMAQKPIKNLGYYLGQVKTSNSILKDFENQNKSAGIDSLIV